MGLEKKALGHNLWFYFRCRFPFMIYAARMMQKPCAFLIRHLSLRNLGKAVYLRQVGQKLALKSPLFKQKKNPGIHTTNTLTLPNTKCSHLLQGVGASDGMDVSYLLPRFFRPWELRPSPLQLHFFDDLLHILLATSSNQKMEKRRVNPSNFSTSKTNIIKACTIVVG